MRQFFYRFLPTVLTAFKPLDVDVFRSFKRFVDSAMDSSMKNNRETRITICSIPEIISISLPQAAIHENISSECEI
jgi:hypothetical protein